MDEAKRSKRKREMIRERDEKETREKERGKKERGMKPTGSSRYICEIPEEVTGFLSEIKQSRKEKPGNTKRKEEERRREMKKKKEAKEWIFSASETLDIYPPCLLRRETKKE